MKKTSPNSKSIWQKILWESCAIIIVAVLCALVSNSLRQTPFPLLRKNTSSETQQSTVSMEDISLQEARALFFSGKAVFLDARPTEFYNLGHIRGAINLPYEEFDELFPTVMRRINHDSTIITYCDGEGCQLSKKLALTLKENGYTNVKILENGWTTWKEADLPTDTDNNGLTR